MSFLFTIEAVDYFFKKTDSFLRAVLALQQNGVESTKDSPIFCVSTHAQPPLLWTSPTR